MAQIKMSRVETSKSFYILRSGNTDVSGTQFIFTPPFGARLVRVQQALVPFSFFNVPNDTDIEIDATTQTFGAGRYTVRNAVDELQAAINNAHSNIDVSFNDVQGRVQIQNNSASNLDVEILSVGSGGVSYLSSLLGLPLDTTFSVGAGNTRTMPNGAQVYPGRVLYLTGVARDNLSVATDIDVNGSAQSFSAGTYSSQSAVNELQNVINGANVNNVSATFNDVDNRISITNNSGGQFSLLIPSGGSGNPRRLQSIIGLSVGTTFTVDDGKTRNLPDAPLQNSANPVVGNNRVRSDNVSNILAMIPLNANVGGVNVVEEQSIQTTVRIRRDERTAVEFRNELNDPVDMQGVEFVISLEILR